ncbi:MAG: hypothetical protein L6R41_008413 [Letrouitia leprolyta]|nr:MAG: hypothetical protein L6R41_008413 [Letrouitia leprolyta]
MGAIVLTRSFKSSDPRDKVFALLGFYDECDELLPDYTKSVLDVLTEATEFQLKYAEELIVLSLVEDKRYRQLKALPSWVPDYSVRTLDSVGIVKQNVFCVSRGLKPEWKVKEPGVLSLRAMQIDEVTCVGESKLEWETAWVDPKWVSILRGMNDIYTTGEDKLEAFWRTLIEDTDDRWNDIEDPSKLTHPASASLAQSFRCSILVRASWAVIDARHSPSSEQSIAAIFASLELLSTMDPCNLIPTVDEVRQFVDRESSFVIDELRTDKHIHSLPHEFLPYPEALRAVKEARFFRTSKGYMGTGSLSMEEGNSIWLTPGAEVFFILREKPGTDRFELVGDAYVHGLMHGEACKDVEGKSEMIEIV